MWLLLSVGYLLLLLCTRTNSNPLRAYQLDARVLVYSSGVAYSVAPSAMHIYSVVVLVVYDSLANAPRRDFSGSGDTGTWSDDSA